MHAQTRGLSSFVVSLLAWALIICVVFAVWIFLLSFTACATSSPRISYDLEEAIALKGIGQDQIGKLFDYINLLYAEERAPTGEEIGYWKSKREDLAWLVTYITSRLEVHEGRDWWRIINLILKVYTP